ncbi:ATP synthase F1 subunit epsilon [Ilumatobacter sp.]|uniref:ATP synthase F1 subunit epsilon n=1 Tax=Ilumatobacter sp. TaxID=1967498 RepID=UPI003B51CA47
MAEPMKVDVVSPEEVLFSGEADMVITRTAGGGEIAFQAGHQPFVGGLVENHTRIFLTDGSVQDVAVHSGFVEVGGEPTRISLLCDMAEMAEDIDVDRARQALERHGRTANSGGDDSDVAQAVAGTRRAKVRLRATGNEGSFTA